MTGKRAYDMAVIGGGPAGVAAAVAGAGAGATVLLLDQWDRLGGSVAAGLHRCLCGLYSHAPQDPLDTLNGGVQRAVIARMLQKSSQSVRHRQLGQAWVLEFPTALWVAALTEMWILPSERPG